MNLADYENIISSLAVSTTVLQFLSGTLVCKQYVVNRTTAETSSLPFVSGILCCCLWFLYGLVKPDNVIILVNSIGVTLMLSYTAVFYIYTFKKSTVLKQVFCAVAFVIFIICFTLSDDDKEVHYRTLEITACTITILTIAAPMSKLLYVVRVRSTECLPFPMILMSFFVSMMWFIYGAIKNDEFLWMTNLFGAALSVIQLSLFVIYPNKSPSSSIKNLIA